MPPFPLCTAYGVVSIHALISRVTAQILKLADIMSLFSPTTAVETSLQREIEELLQSFLDSHIIDEGLNYEVEAKLGRFIDRNTESRISLPVMNTCGRQVGLYRLNPVLVLRPGDWYRFEAEISVQHHRAFNELLNKQVPLRAKHRHEKTLDTIYITPHRQKVRISREQESGRILGSIEKRRIADLSLHLPLAAFDVRISINTETQTAIPNEEALKSWRMETERRKDRISYDFNHFFQVDLTQVIPRASPPKYELEIEVINVQGHLRDDPQTVPRFLASILELAKSI